MAEFAATYVRPQNDEDNCSRLTVGGDRINFEGDCLTPTASLLTVKLLFNNIVSTLGAKVLGLDLKDFYLNTPMKCPKFLQMKLTNFPDDVIDHYKFNGKVTEDGYVY